jgi:hypothetical protein
MLRVRSAAVQKRKSSKTNYVFLDKPYTAYDVVVMQTQRPRLPTAEAMSSRCLESVALRYEKTKLPETASVVYTDLSHPPYHPFHPHSCVPTAEHMRWLCLGSVVSCYKMVGLSESAYSFLYRPRQPIVFNSCNLDHHRVQTAEAADLPCSHSVVPRYKIANLSQANNVLHITSRQPTWYL